MKKAIMSVLTMWILVSSMFIGLISFSDIENVQAPYIPHNPIRINSDAEFASMAGIEGWAGNGLPGNPYIIEGYDINGSGYGYCIYIGNTTVYFEVRDCYLHEASGGGSDPYYLDSGIMLYNVQNSTITNNTASNNQYGILLPYSSNNTIANNTASPNYWEGVFLFSSSNNTIANNTISSNNGYSIYLSSSSSNTVANNTVSSNSKYGIYLSSSSSNTIVNNEMMDNGIFIWGDMLENWNTHFIDTTNTVNGKPVHYWKNQTGGIVPLDAGQVILANCTYVVVENQNVSNGDVGIELGFSSNNTIANNTASSNKKDGISLFYSNGNTVANNNASNNWIGIFLYSSSNNTISNNNVSNNWDGIFLSSSSSNIIANNIASSNNDYGIHFFSTCNNTINNNNVSTNDYGIYLDSSSNSNTIANNTASNNACGIYLSLSSNNTITNNNASNNGVVGILLDFSSNNTIANNNLSNNEYGIYLFSSSISNTITNNIVSSNNLYGIYIANSATNNLYHNIIRNNLINQAYDDTINGNQWDNGYPTGGNYWSDYGGVDNFQGPNQDIPGGDGIGDTNYSIDSDSIDNYPLMSPFTNRTFENYTTLKQGWNLISIPLIQQNESLRKVLEMIDGWYDAVQWYNASDSSDPWKHYQISKPSHLNDLNDIEHKMAFWIHITNPGDTIFLYNGTQPTSNQTIPLHPGWNMVGYPSLSNRNRTAALNNLTFGVEVDAIWTFDGATQTWEEIGGGDYFEVGRGYWVHATQECVWEVGI